MRTLTSPPSLTPSPPTFVPGNPAPSVAARLPKEVAMSRTPHTRLFHSAPMLLLAVTIALGVGARSAAASPFKRDGEVCRTNQSCCGTNGHNGVCVKQSGAKFGVCCTPATSCPSGQNCGTASDGCSGTIDCGTCPAGDICTAGTCCTRNCAGSNCGDDGCGGSCGTCTALAVGRALSYGVSSSPSPRRPGRRLDQLELARREE